MDWIEREIKEQEKYAREAKAEKEAFAELIDGVEKISIGFDKVAKYLKTMAPFADRIEGHEKRIQELIKKKEEFKNQEAVDASQ